MKYLKKVNFDGKKRWEKGKKMRRKSRA